MNNKKFDKLISFLIYMLTLCLIYLILYNAYLLFKINYSSNPPPKNSINVGPIPVDCLKIIY